ncbi:STAS domain-containing protein [Proteobacteria bacterium 005FR1]|nr:STAS domain-containing protein [Proteobacteria bacterium 005FR1]
MNRSPIPILKIKSTLITSVQTELQDETVDLFQQDILTRIEKTGARSLVIDISALDALDTYVARMLTSTGKMAKLMGARTVIVGMRPEVAATLVRMGFPLSYLETALSLEEGLSLVNQPIEGFSVDDGQQGD